MNDYERPDCQNTIPCLLQNPYAPYEMPITPPPSGSISGIREPGIMNYSQMRNGQYRDCNYKPVDCQLGDGQCTNGRGSFPLPPGASWDLKPRTFNGYQNICRTCSGDSGLGGNCRGCGEGYCDKRDCYQYSCSQPPAWNSPNGFPSPYCGTSGSSGPFVPECKSCTTCPEIGCNRFANLTSAKNCGVYDGSGTNSGSGTDNFKTEKMSGKKETSNWFIILLIIILVVNVAIISVLFYDSFRPKLVST